MLKRAVDIVVGSTLAALALPFVLLGAIGCAISLRAWPFFVQQRVGRGGKHFPLPKLRTLPTTAPAAIDKYGLAGMKIPLFCRFLRRTHLDELPQLLVVPLGWMSLVGPRPEMPNLLKRYPSDFAAARSTVRPGCTGLWQISTASGKLIYETPEYDVVYAEHYGLRLDAWILYRTVRLMGRGRATIDLDDLPAWTLRPGASLGDAVVVDLRDPTDSAVIDLRDDDSDTGALVAFGGGTAAASEIVVEIRPDNGELRPA